MAGRWVTAAAIGLLAMFAGGWLAASRFESPAQREARARPPAPRPIVAAVTTGTLADEVTARADVGAQVSDRLSPPAVPERAVVTNRLLPPGSEIRPGAAVLAVNGRPLIVMPGRFAFYRDIVAGSEGPDVAQLQAGLAAAGISSGMDPIGTYGDGTQQAVRALYASVGTAPLTRPGPITPEAKAAAKKAKTEPKPPQLPVVPLTEVVVAPNLPARLDSALGVGAQPTADKPVMTLASGTLVAHAGVAPSVVARIRPGMKARLVGAGGRGVPARVTAVKGSHKGGGEDLRDVVLTARRKPLPAQWRGRNVLARITTQLVRRRALIVPTRALAAGGTGDAYVLKQVGAGEFVRVAVRPLGSLAGRSAVAPLERGALRAADAVRVG